MKEHFFRFCSTILVLILLINMLPLSIFAEEFQQSIVNAEATSAAELTEGNSNGAQITEEVVSKRTEYSKEFMLTNGLHMAVVYPDAVHYEQNGQWEEIDNTLKSVRGVGGTAYTNTAGVWQVSFPGSLNATNAVTIEKDGYTLSFFMAGELRTSGNLSTAAIGGQAAEQFSTQAARTATAQVQEIDFTAQKAAAEHPETVLEKQHSRLQYADVYENTNIIYDLSSNEVKESVVLEQYSSTLRGYQYTLHTGAMIPVLNEDGSITLYDEKQQAVVMHMPAPYLVDAAEEYCYDVAVSLKGSNGTYVLAYILPQSWLAEESRQWPVILDPVVQAAINITNIKDQTVCENANLDYEKSNLFVGHNVDMGICRIFLKYQNLPQLTSSDVIISATVQLYKNASGETVPVEVHKVLGPWQSSTITWDTMPVHNTNIEDYANTGAIGYYSWNVTDIARDWYTGENTGMMFKVSDEIENARDDRYKRFRSSDQSNANTRPTLTILFRNNNGLESYWDYTSASAGRAGTGHVNNFTGNLVWVRSDIGFGGNRMPVEISHVYNLNDAIAPSDSNNSNDSANTFGMGIGWRTNLNQLVYRWKLNDVDQNYYIWEDADGTDHYFTLTDGQYRDEDNRDRILTVNTDSTEVYVITEADGSSSAFDDRGRLIRISNNQKSKSSITIAYDSTSNLITSVNDGIGRKYEFTYAGDLLNKISYKSTGATEISYVTFGYTAYGELTTITDKDGAVSNYSYLRIQKETKCDSLLQSVRDVDGYTLTYTFTTPAADYQPYRVLSVSETDGTAAGGMLTFDYAHNQTTITDHNQNQEQNRLIMQFNDFGNTVCIVDDEGRAVFSKYALNTDKEVDDNQDPSKSKNQLRVSSDLQYSVSNLLVDNDMRQNTGWSTYGSNVTLSVNETYSYMDAKSLTVDLCPDGMTAENLDTGTPRGIQSGLYSVAPGETLTFSCHIRAYPDCADSVYLMAKSAVKEEKGTTIIMNYAWKRLQVSYCNDTKATQDVRFYVLSGDGTNGFYMDCSQLEQTQSASRYNLINNGDFRYSADTDYGWEQVNCTTTDGVVTRDTAPAPQLDNNAYVLNGSTGSAKCVKQRIAVSGSAGDLFTLSGWAMGNSVPLENYDSNASGAREYALRCTLNYSNGATSDPFIARFNPDIDGWQYSAVQIHATTDFQSVDVELVCDYLAGAVCFDGIQLYREVSGSSATYYEDGNLKTVTDANGRVTEYIYYDGTNDVHMVYSDDIRQMTYAYDDFHNVTSTTDRNGTVTTYGYDLYGNNISVTVQNGSTTSTSTFAYTADGNRLVSSTDELNRTTVFSYNADTNVLEWVKNPNDTDGTNGTVDTRTHYTYDSIYRPAAMAATTNTGLSLSAVYGYTEDYLTSVQTASTLYNFTYGDFGLRQSVSADGNTLMTYSYTNDQNRYLSAVTYGNQDSVSYAYDSKGRVIKQTYEDGAYVTFTYSSSGALAKTYDSETGITTSYTYDYAGRLQRYDEKGPDNYSYSLYYSYNDKGQIAATSENTNANNNGLDRWAAMRYDRDDRLTYFHKDRSTREYTYDALGRVSSTTLSHQHTASDPTETPFLTTTYTYNGATSQVARLQYSGSYYHSGNTTLSYTYDANGNITSVKDVWFTTTYVYDSANQLIRENNELAGYTHVWTYDNAGNITSRSEYAYTTGELGEPTKIVTYTYGDSSWGDLLTGYDGKIFTYDGIGNLTNDGTWSYTWKHGRELATMSDGSTTWNYTYNADGMRTFRTNNDGRTYRYVYNGGELDYLRVTEKNSAGNVIGWVLRFSHTPEGTPLSVSYAGNIYYYITNLQGDVIALVDKDGEQVVEYTYDAWGNILYITGDMANTLGKRNPLRYRGYVYDTETGLYYVSSRYYDPEIGRFINADDVDLLGANGDFASLNLFAYCGNNPVSRADSSGYLWTNILIGAVVGAVAGVVGQVISDVVTSVLNGEVTISNWQTYTGAAVGGAAGGVVLATTGNMNAANAVTGTVTTGVGQSLEKLTINNYNKSWAEIGVNAAVDGAVSYGLGKIPGIKGATAGRNSWSAVYKSGLTKLRNGTAAIMSAKVVAKGLGSSIVGGFALDGYYGVKQHAYDRVKSLLN